MEDTHIYTRAYFRIEAGYVWGKGLPREQLAPFYQEVMEILSLLGFSEWTQSFSSSCPRGKRGVESLYCHPMDISGYVKKARVSEIERALSSAKTFRLRGVDMYGDLKNYTAEELAHELEARRDEVAERMIQAYKTKRRNLFMLQLDHFRAIPDRLDLPELNVIENTFLSGLFHGLLADKRIVSRVSPTGVTVYRAASSSQKAIIF